MAPTTAEKGKTPPVAQSVMKGTGKESEAPGEATVPSREIQKYDPAMSERFTSMIIREFSSIMGNGSLVLNDQQKRLAQHMFAKMDATLQELEKKRLDKNETGKVAIVWANVNMQKLSLDAVHRIELGLDALIPNHISPIPYWNARMKKYDVDLRVGYTGKDYYRRKVALDSPKDVRYHLVYTNDKLTVFMKSKTNPIETYEFEIPEPFNRGEVKGGFAYLEYEDASKNKIVLLALSDFNKAKSAAKSPDFWSKYPEQMQYKTLVHRATDKLQIDPAKINASYLAVENDDASDALEVQAQIEESANKGKVIDMIPEDTNPKGTDDLSATNEMAAKMLKDADICVCGEMISQQLAAWDCPVHGRYQGGKFSPSPAQTGPAEPAKKGPGF